jgi:hypothetical protein
MGMKQETLEKLIDKMIKHNVIINNSGTRSESEYKRRKQYE